MTTIIGVGQVGPSDRLEAPLDEMIFDATAAALAAAGQGAEEVDLVCAAASDVFDGRGISTMTLTESLGSVGRWEHRVCNDSLVALDLAAAHVDAGLSRAATVGAWHKGSDIVDPSLLALTAIEPLRRDLGLPPAVFAALSAGEQIVDAHPQSEPMRDVAITMVVTARDTEAGSSVRAHRRATWEYLHQTQSRTDRLRSILAATCSAAGLTDGELAGIFLTGSLCRGIDVGPRGRLVPASVSVGYAAGLIGVSETLDAGPGVFAVCSASSIGDQEIAVTIIENES